MQPPLQVCQTTIFHDRDFFTFASPLPTVKPRFFSLTRPFGIEVWAMIMATVFITGVAFFFVSNIEVTLSSCVQLPRRKLFSVFSHSGLTCWIQFQRVVLFLRGFMVLLRHIDWRGNHQGQTLRRCKWSAVCSLCSLLKKP